MKHYRHAGGFTVLELAVVVLLSGVILVAAMQAYGVYIAGERPLKAYAKNKAVQEALSDFLGANRRYPCPADPTLDMENPHAGVEQCTLILAVGACSGGICKVAGQRDTEADPDSTVDPVLIGGVPFRSIGESKRASMASPTTTVEAKARSAGVSRASLDVLDPWGNQLTYAVSEHMTAVATFKSSFGVIDVQKEDGASLTDPAKAVHYVLVSHGDNGAGARDSAGIMGTACIAGTLEEKNCKKATSNGVFVSGLRSMGSPASQYFDDTVLYGTYVLSSLWDYSPISGFKNDLRNLNEGNVGVGTDTPQEKLDIWVTAPGEKATIRAGGAGATPGSFKSPELCDRSGINCFPADLLGGTTGMRCPPAPSGPGFINLVTGVKNNSVVCAEVVLPSLRGKSCPLSTPQKYIAGIDSSGAIICCDPADTACTAPP